MFARRPHSVHTAFDAPANANQTSLVPLIGWNGVCFALNLPLNPLHKRAPVRFTKTVLSPLPRCMKGLRIIMVYWERSVTPPPTQKTKGRMDTFSSEYTGTGTAMFRINNPRPIGSKRHRTVFKSQRGRVWDLWPLFRKLQQFAGVHMR